jgi:plastocyanin
MSNRATAIILGALSVIIVAALIAYAALTKPGPACAQTGANHTVSIINNRPRPADISVRLCDKLTFVNKDNLTREIAFGAHDNHVPYDGVTERFLNKDQSFTITLNKVGTYHWHDHLHDEIQGDFTVNK